MIGSVVVLLGLAYYYSVGFAYGYRAWHTRPNRGVRVSVVAVAAGILWPITAILIIAAANPACARVIDRQLRRLTGNTTAAPSHRVTRADSAAGA